MTPPAATVERSPEDVGHMGPAERLVCPRTSGWLLRCSGQTLICPRSSGRCSAAGSMLGPGRRDPWPRTPHARRVLGWSGRQDLNLPKHLHLCLSERDQTSGECFGCNSGSSRRPINIGSRCSKAETQESIWAALQRVAAVTSTALDGLLASRGTVRAYR